MDESNRDQKSGGKFDADEHFHSKLELLIKFIQWLDTWKKLWIFIVLLFFIGSGSLLYFNQGVVLKWLDYISDSVHLNMEKIDPEVKSLVVDTHADMGAVWSINRKEKVRVLSYMIVDGQRIRDLEGGSDVIVSSHSEVSSLIIDLFNESTICDYVSATSDVGKLLAKSGFGYYCAVTIPSGNRSMIGVVIVGFRSRPTNQDYIKQRLRISADRLIQ